MVYKVTERLEGCHPIHLNYPLLPGDILMSEPEGTYFKSAPGLGIMGFKLSDEQRQTLEELDEHPPIEFI